MRAEEWFRANAPDGDDSVEIAPGHWDTVLIGPTITRAIADVLEAARDARDELPPGALRARLGLTLAALDKMLEGENQVSAVCFECGERDLSLEDIEEDVQCARCGSSMGFDDEAWTDTDEHDPSGRWRCLSDREWCEANPRPGREAVPARWTPEWFEVLGDGTVRY